MICAWNEYLSVLPKWLAAEVDRKGRDQLRELRLRLGQPPELKTDGKPVRLERLVTKEDLDFIVNTASRYSPWSSSTVASGYLTIQGGHRIGICGECVIKEKSLSGFRKITALNLRVARDFPGISKGCAGLQGSVLVLGPPGCGKTTLLRDLLRRRAEFETVGVVDERGELFQSCFRKGQSMDVLTGCGKAEGMEILLRTMGPDSIGVDEITSESDAAALIKAGWCGVELLATAHACSLEDFRNRPVYKPLAESGLFDHILVLHRDKSWHQERMGA